MDNYNEKQKKSAKEEKRKTEDVTLNLLDTEGVNAHPLGKSDLDSELEDASKDVASDENWTEETEDKISPQFKAGSPEIDRSSIDERFSKEHYEVSEEELRKTKKLNAKSGGGTSQSHV